MNHSPAGDETESDTEAVALETSLPTSAAAPGAARRAVSGWLTGYPNREDAILATSEIVTNAVRHAEQSEDSRLALRCERHGRSVRISVQQDAASGYLPVVSSPPDTEAAGRGLAIVTRLADRWGVSHEAGLTVWFEFDNHRP